MPTVPYPVSRVDRAAVPGVRVSVDTPSGAFGVGSALDLSGPTKLLASIVDAHRQEAEETQVIAADNQLHDLKASIQRDTVQAFRGINALGAKDSAKAAWEKGVAEIQQGIKGGDHIQAIVARRAATHFGDLVSNVESHADSEYRQAQTREFATAVDNRTANAVQDFADPARRQFAIDDGKSIITLYAKRAGWSPDETRHRLEEFASATHSSIIERMVNEHQDIPARQYLQEHRTELSGHDLAAAERLTGEASVLGEAQRQSDRITSTSPTLTLALADAAKLENPRVREDTERRIRQHFNDVATADREAKAQAFTQASAIVEKTGSFDAVPLKVRMAMSPEQNSALAHRVEQIRHPKEPGDPDTYFHLLNLASLSPESRTQFLKENLTPAGYPNLSSSERQKLMTLQRQLSVRSEGATETHQSREMLREAEAEQQRTDHLTEAELRKTDPAASEVLRAENFRKRQAKYHGTHAPGTASAPVVPAGPSAAKPLAGLLTPAPVILNPTSQMLQDAAKSPAYAEYLRNMHVDLPTAPTVPEAKRAPAPAAAAPAAPVVRPPSAPVRMAPAVVTAQPPVQAPAPSAAQLPTAQLAPVSITAPANAHPEAAVPTARLAPITVTEPRTPAKPAVATPAASAKPAPGVPYEKSGHMVVDTPRKDSAGHVPTHRLDQPTNRRADETWTQYEDRVLTEKSKPADSNVRSDLKVLDPDVQRAAALLITAAKKDGVTLEPRETVRTQSRQEHLFRQGRAGSGAVVTWTLTSDHTPGRAIDFHENKKAVKWLKANAEKFGFTTLGDMDPGHVSMPTPGVASTVASK